MALFTLDLRRTSKRINSTSTAGELVLAGWSCSIKEGSSLFAPVLALQIRNPDLATIRTCNQAVVHMTNDYYYWITDIAYADGVIGIECEIDALATYKADIGAYTGMIERATAEYDPWLIDGYIPLKSIQTLSPQNEAVGFDGTGTVLITCAGMPESGNSEAFYALLPDNWQKLYANFFASGFLSSYKTAWDAIVQDVVNTVLKPEDFISSAIWVPVAYSSIVGRRDRNITIGFSNTGIAGKALDPNTIILKNIKQFTIPEHPQVQQYGDWVSYNHCMSVTIALPGYGQAVVDMSKLNVAGRNISVGYSMDCSGKIVYDVIIGSYRQLYTADVSVPVGWHSSRSDVMGAIGNATSAVKSLASGGVINGITSLYSAIDDIVPDVERMSTGGGGRAIADITPDITVTASAYFLPENPDFSEIGRPLFKSKQISTIPGFIKCIAPMIGGPAPKPVKAEINDYMREGFFYE